jgi:hypothetical protein
MLRIAALASGPGGTIDGRDLRGRLLEAGAGYHRAGEAPSQAYDETDRLSGAAGQRWSRAWCRIAALRERAVLRRARQSCHETSDPREAIVAEVLGGGAATGPSRLFASEEVAAPLAFVAGEPNPTG